MVNLHAQALGRIKTKKKAKSSKENGEKGEKPHFKKVDYFLKNYPYKLENNEYKDKFPIGFTEKKRISTYNPDYFCKKTGFYIEITTSKPNISTQGWKWKEAIKRGLKLKVFWWEGKDITKNFK